ncbi:hypothetical protein QF036_004929 [Arthrobacter globiformis]|nr:hypothetical protein [Arthrobacter globiformis]
MVLPTHIIIKIAWHRHEHGQLDFLTKRIIEASH